jgi:demethylmenaquinone methyltransferase/2-methoxy-6-polyprenyl-1,4-benzoquinol methylase
MKSMTIPDHLTLPLSKRKYNRWLFGIVAKRYNIVTWVLSFGRDNAWKKWLVAHIPAQDAPVIIDIASGNGDIAFRLGKKYPRSFIVAADLTREMFALAQKRHIGRQITYVLQDMSLLGLKNASADFVTGGYALRNAPDLENAVGEARRVLKSNGIAAFLDFSKPASRIFAPLEYWLLKFWGNLWGIVFHGNPEIYGYIADSHRAFPARPALHVLLEKHNLAVAQSKLFFFGLVEATICKAVSPGQSRPGSRPLSPQ